MKMPCLHGRLFSRKVNKVNFMSVFNRTEKKTDIRFGKGKRALGCVVLLAVASLPAIFLNNVFGYLPALMLAFLLLFSYVYIRLQKKALSFEEHSDFSDCKRGTDSKFSVRIKNRSLLMFPRLEVLFSVSDIFGDQSDLSSASVVLGPFEDRIFHFEICFKHIGVYDVGLKRLVIHDLLGLFHIAMEKGNICQICVAPRIFDFGKIEISNQAAAETKKMLVPNALDGMDYMGVRDYVWGDPIKRIHWKLSARSDNYVTRQFESYNNTGISVIMDFCIPSDDREISLELYDRIVETALSVEAYAIKNGIESDVLYLDKKEKKCTYMTIHSDDVSGLVPKLPRPKKEPGRYSVLDLLLDEASAAYAQGNLALCTSDITDRMARTLAEVKMHRRKPMLFAILPASLGAEEENELLKPLQILEHANIPYYVLRGEDGLWKGGQKHVS